MSKTIQQAPKADGAKVSDPAVVTETIITTDSTVEELEAQKIKNQSISSLANEISNAVDGLFTEEVTQGQAESVNRERTEALAALKSAYAARDSAQEFINQVEGRYEGVAGSVPEVILNEDGLVPGAPVDFETINKINGARSPEFKASLREQVKQNSKR